MSRSGEQQSTGRSLLDDYLQNPKLDLPDVVGMACDLLLAGVDTVSQHEILFIFRLISTSFNPIADNLFNMFPPLSSCTQSACAGESLC